MVPKSNLSPQLFTFLETEFLKKLRSPKTSREFERNGQINCSLLMLLANGEPVYGSDETYDVIYSNLLEKKGQIGHIADLESLLFYYNHIKFDRYLREKGEQSDKYLKLIQLSIAKNFDKLEQFCDFDNLTRLMLGVQKVHHLTQFHPKLCTKLVNLSRKILTTSNSLKNESKKNQKNDNL